MAAKPTDDIAKLQARVERMRKQARRDKEQLKSSREEVQRLTEEVKSSREEMQRLTEQWKAAERQNAMLISLAVSTLRLHSSLRYVDVIKVMNEIILNLVGADIFGIYLLDKSKGRVSLITSTGYRGDARSVGEKSAEATVRSGELRIRSVDEQADENEPVASIPLKVQEETLGAIVVHQLLPQKSALIEQDFEIFRLLGENASTAILGAKLYEVARAETKRGFREDFGDLMPPKVRVSTHLTPPPRDP